MLEIITQGFNKAKDRLSGRIEISESNIEDALKDIRLSLLEADVHFNVVKNFIAQVKSKALGEVVETRVSYRGKRLKASPADHFIRICHDELVALMGPVDASVRFGARPVTAIMLLGLQGCGKTTTAGKLAKYLTFQNKKPLLVAADIYRPAAVDQLHIVGRSINIPVYSHINASPPEICSQSMEYAHTIGCNAVIFDTAGRLAIDDSLMHELEAIVANTHPENILLVCDAMVGQDAVKTAEEFNKRLDISGFILTKLDGDARGGAALSIKETTGKPIKFIGTGEALDRIEEFRPEGLASRILGFGDIVGLMKDFEDVVDQKTAEHDALRILKGQFTLLDFLQQIQAIKKMGPLQDLVDKIPFFSQMASGASIDEREFIRVESIINSMTPEERRQPDIISESRKQRIAHGSARTVKDVNELLKKFSTMRTMMKDMGRSGIIGKFSRGLQGLSTFGDEIELGNSPLARPSAKTLRVPQNMSVEKKKKIKAKRKQAKKDRRKGRKR
jgi:signal recognition particle subunit SRP54